VDQKLTDLIKNPILFTNITGVFGMVVLNVIVQILLIMEDLYETTIERSEELKKAGYNLIEMWECEWTKSKEYKKGMKQIEEKIKELEELETHSLEEERMQQNCALRGRK
jgi:tRNA(Ile)-lysidine synthase TilS/MesJ